MMNRDVVEHYRQHRLEGWLTKYCKGPLGGFKKRWIWFNPHTLKLECFKQSTDKIPLDSIDIQRAVLTINCQDELPSIIEAANQMPSTGGSAQAASACNSFRIICGEKVWILEADTPQSCIDWLHRLQKLRKRLGQSDKNGDLNDFDMLSDLVESECLINSSDLPDENFASSLHSGPHSSSNNSLDQSHSAYPASVGAGSANDQLANHGSHPQHPNHQYPNHQNPNHQHASQHANANYSTPPISYQASGNRNRVLSNILTKIQRRSDDGSTAPREQPPRKQCVRCKELEDQIITLQDDLNALESEMFGNKEVIKVLQIQIDQIIAEKETYERLCKSLTIDSNDSSNELIEKECELAQCRVKLRQTEEQLTSVRDENAALKEKTSKLREEIKLLEEVLQVKDQTVISLTNEIFANKPASSFHSFLDANSFPSSETYIKPQLPKLSENEQERLRDSVTAFQAQNQFLNREIIELNEAKRQHEVKMQKLEWAIVEWEAKCCQIQSKLLSLLKEINSIEEKEDAERTANQEGESGAAADRADREERKDSIATNETIKALVQRLLDENSLDIPMSWRNAKKNKKENLIIEYDELGFQNKLVQDSEFDDLFVRNNNTQQSLEDELEEKQWKQRWDLYISSLSNNDQRLVRGTELKQLLRSGVPSEYRPKIWRMCVNSLIEHKKPANDPNYYANLVKASQNRRNWNPSIKQIELDLLRTLPNNKNFESKECDGINRLRRVLTAYSQRNPALGYCQGMNRLAAVALLFLSEEDAFWCLVAIIEAIMPKDYYTQSLLGAHVDQYVLKDLIAEKLPNLHAHFEKYNIEISLFGWFLTLFIDNLAVRIYLRIWDSLLHEGSKVLFRFALAFLKYHEANLLSLTDMMSINQYLRVFGEKTYDLKRLCTIAYSDLNPFPMSKIKQKREIYRLEVSRELEKLENLKNASDSDAKTLENDSQSD